MPDKQSFTRNFAILAHIDHGKSTLADRFLELTGTVEKRQMKEQLLDSMDLERERGITIKLTPVRMLYRPQNQNVKIKMQNDNGKLKNDSPMANTKILNFDFYTLNLIDTPGHADFGYEVSRSLAAVQGAILLVDATQGVQAQTLANLYAALAQNLTIIPVVNKIDLANADPERSAREILELVGCKEGDILYASAKTGVGVTEILDAVVARVPAPSGNPLASLRALIFDSLYDTYRGVVAYVCVVDGEVRKGDVMVPFATGKQSEVLEVGTFSPKYTARESLAAGETGYIVTGLKDITACRVGDTITSAASPTKEPLPGYEEVKPMVFAGFFPKNDGDIERLRDAVEKLKMNDAAFSFTPEHSQALGYGFRCGFLGLLHLDIIRERLAREYNMQVVVTVPSVGYHLTKNNGETIVAHGAVAFPDPSFIRDITEPWVRMDIITPEEYVGGTMQMVQDFRGVYVQTEYLGSDSARRVILHYELPLSQILVDFYDRLKSVSQGYASMNYELLDYRPANVRRMDILVAEIPEESLATIVYEDEAQEVGRRIVTKLKESLPKQWFDVKLQAALGGKIVAAERLSAFRKDVTGHLYGGDVTRKKKLLEKQKKGKKKMAAIGKGRVDIPPETYLAVLKR